MSSAQPPSTKTTCLEPWHRGLPYDPHSPLESWPQRQRAGKLLRGTVARSRHGDWQPAAHRPDPVALLVASNRGRQKHLVPLRMARMSVSPYAFFRGMAELMAWDLARTPTTSAHAIVSGDAHLNNFGLYGTPQRSVVFDLDDFDEVALGPWEWDLKRLAASVNLAGREHGLKSRDRRDAVMSCVTGYRDNARNLQEQRILGVWYLHHYLGQDALFELDRKTRRVFEKAVERASRRTNIRLLQKIARPSATGDWQFRDDPPILVRVDAATAEKIAQSLVPYAETLSPERGFMLRRYRVVDVAHRVVGVGSVGLRAYLVMLQGNCDRDPLFLQVKEAIPSVLAPHTPPFPGGIAHHGQRVVLGQRILQAATDVLLGWTTIDGRPYYVRQMKNMKGSVPLEWLEGSAFVMYAHACGTLLARAHARSGDIAKIAGYIGKSDAFAEAIANFAEAYGEMAERDFAVFQAAISAGTLPTIAIGS